MKNRRTIIDCPNSDECMVSDKNGRTDELGELQSNGTLIIDDKEVFADFNDNDGSTGEPKSNPTRVMHENTPPSTRELMPRRDSSSRNSGTEQLLIWAPSRETNNQMLPTRDSRCGNSGNE
ncbi:uncharacterized protein LOC117180299 [Belonocnema kinseyi]|uniref:uncharacterized protein LOC117180299 n=1 Tax=Belonocnema kinseyi TaxID=2817044 RepID=UPI00143D07F3|nr:uncharacterized protein LOC117180299 [Belonocnema kinseyi]